MTHVMIKARSVSPLTSDPLRGVRWTAHFDTLGMVTSAALEQSGNLQMVRISGRLCRAVTRAGLAALLFAGSSEAAVRHVLVLQSVERGNLTIDVFTGNF